MINQDSLVPSFFSFQRDTKPQFVFLFTDKTAGFGKTGPALDKLGIIHLPCYKWSNWGP